MCDYRVWRITDGGEHLYCATDRGEAERLHVENGAEVDDDDPWTIEEVSPLELIEVGFDDMSFPDGVPFGCTLRGTDGVLFIAASANAWAEWSGGCTLIGSTDF